MRPLARRTGARFDRCIVRELATVLAASIDTLPRDHKLPLRERSEVVGASALPRW
jgi:hypothetical protein